MLAGIFPTRPDRQYVLTYQAFYIWRFFSMMQPQKIAAGIVGDSIIHLVDIFPFFLLNHHMAGDNGTKVIEKQPCPYFHLDIFPLFRVEIYGSDYMF